MESTASTLKPSIRRKSAPIEEHIVTFDHFLTLIQKDRDKRSLNNIRQMTKYLSANYQYFINMKKSADNDLMHRLVSSLNYEFFKKKQRIINCGDEGNKFYILLKGKVSVHKPFPISVEISFREYVEYIFLIKYKERNEPKFLRITNQNAQIDHYSLYKMNYDYTAIKPSRIKQKYVIEEEKKLAELSDGFCFGEMALIKKEPRNASIYAEEDSILVSLDKYDYNKVIREIEEKRLLNHANEFKKQYPLFNYWGINQLYRLFNYFEKETISFGEYLYKQNQPSDYIYFIDNGIFEMTSLFSFAWYEEFIDFIHDTRFSIVNNIHKRELFDNDDNFHEFIREGTEAMRSPCVLHKRTKKYLRTLPNPNEENVLDVKLEQDDMNHPKNIHHATIKQLSIPECLGYEDALELKPRFTSVKCISSLVEYRKVSVMQFIKLMPHDPINQYIFQRNLFDKKLFLISQLKNNALFQISSIDTKLKEKFIRAIKKEYPFIPKTYVNDKKMLKTLRKSVSCTDLSLSVKVNVNATGVNASIKGVNRNEASNYYDKAGKSNSEVNRDKLVSTTSRKQLDNTHITIASKSINKKKVKTKTNQSSVSLSPLTMPYKESDNNNNNNDHINKHQAQDKDIKQSDRDSIKVGNTSRTIKTKNKSVNKQSELSTKLIEGHSINNRNTNSDLAYNKSSLRALVYNSSNNGCLLSSAQLPNSSSLLISNRKSNNDGYINNNNYSYLKEKQLPQLAHYCLDAISNEKENKKCILKLQNKKIFLKVGQ